jgi:hypothetical protein
MVTTRDNNLSVDQPCQLEVESNVSEAWSVAAIRNCINIVTGIIALENLIILNGHGDPILHDHPLYLGCPDMLSLVEEILSRDGCCSPNRI